MRYILIFILFFTSFIPAADLQTDKSDSPDLYQMSLDELLQIKVTNSGAMTKTNLVKTPAAVTRLYQRDIQELGARSMLELLEIAVPSLQVIGHHWEMQHIGLRGITSDQEDKVMIIINDKVMNARALRGAVTERDFPLMEDIRYIDVIRGAGSSMYGLGAVSTVIKITTYDAESLPRNSVTLKGGAFMPYAALSGNYAKKLRNNFGIYAHSELAYVKGADDENAPLVFGADGVSIETGDTIYKGTPFPTISRDGEGFEGKPFIKAHLGLSHNKTNLWFRYNQAGRNSATVFQNLTEPPVGFGTQTEEKLLKVGYKQFTSTLDQEHAPRENIAINWMVSYDKAAIERTTPASSDGHEEDELFSRGVLNWRMHEKHELSVGLEGSYEKFLNIQNSDTWNSYTVSFLSEWQWNPHDYFTTFTGLRLDKNRYSELLYSPRVSLVFSHDNINFYKLLLTQSQRMNAAVESHNADLSGNKISDPEVLRSVELRYERSVSKLFIGVSPYYIDLDVIGWDNTLHHSTNVGNQKQWGFEGEVEAKLQSHRIRASYAYTKLIDFELYSKKTWITAMPFGYGEDLADWAAHSAKLWHTYLLNEKLSFTTTVRAFWDYQGSKDYRDKLIDDGKPFVTPDWEKAYEEQIYVNLGSQYKPRENIMLSLQFHNLLGLIDKDFNKRLIRSLGSYRSEAVAISLLGSVSF